MIDRMIAMVDIRRIEANEAQAVLALWDEAADNSLTPQGRATILRYLEVCASHPEHFCLVAHTDGQLSGFVIAHTSSHPVFPGLGGEIDELYVCPAARQRGIGSALVEQAVTELHKQDVAVIHAKVEIEEPQAMAFWQHTGWKNVFTTFTLYKADE